MRNNFKPISISLSPNTEKDDIWLAFKLLFMPWKWRRGIRNQEGTSSSQARAGIKSLEEKFKKYLGVKYAFSFNSGRSSLLAILKSLGLPFGSEVLLQAFTCNAAANPIIWAGLKPIYVDCNKDDFNINISDLKAKIGPNSKVLMVQHTFGMPANMDEILAITCPPKPAGEGGCDSSLILIEDCAHALGAEYKGQKVGTFGKAAFFSFSRDKIISSVYGGVAVTNDDELAKKIGEFQQKIKYPPCCWIFQQLLHPVLLNWIILPIYNFIDLGKIFLVLSQWFHILSKAVLWKEKRGERPDYFPKRLPNALALLALNQFKKLEKFNNYRQKVAEFYYKELKNTSYNVKHYKVLPSEARHGSYVLPPQFSDRKNVFLRFTIKHQNAHNIIWRAWHKENILLGDWYTTPIAPFDTKLEKMQYKLGMCPSAEKLAKTTFNLPTHINISQKDAEKIINFLKKF